MGVTVLRGRGVSGGIAEGQALVTTQPVGFLGVLDPESGRVVERGHELEGQGVTGRVLVPPGGEVPQPAPTCCIPLPEGVMARRPLSTSKPTR